MDSWRREPVSLMVGAAVFIDRPDDPSCESWMLCSDLERYGNTPIWRPGRRGRRSGLQLIYLPVSAA
jgi:hypothetical protein